MNPILLASFVNTSQTDPPKIGYPSFTLGMRSITNTVLSALSMMGKEVDFIADSVLGVPPPTVPPQVSK